MEEPKRKKRPFEVQPKDSRWVGIHAKFYNSRKWRNLRAQFLQGNPVCVRCQEEGRAVAATVADHIIPIRKGGQPWSESNLQPLCAKHHNIKSASDDR